MSEVIAATFDPDSATSGIQEAIDALGERGGRVRIPAGEWRLRRSVVLPAKVSLVGDGPATTLDIIGNSEIAPEKRGENLISNNVY